jgi:hypothetical protein
MSEKQFAIARRDGRSNQRVILDYVHQSEPETIFSYDELKAILEEGLPVTFSRHRIQDCIRQVNPQLLRQHQRMLTNVKNVGYRMAPAREHLPSSRAMQEKANRRMLAGLRMLENVREKELTPSELQLHRAHTMIQQATVQTVLLIQRRQDIQEQAINNLFRRVEDLENTQQ